MWVKGTDRNVFSREQKFKSAPSNPTEHNVVGRTTHLVRSETRFYVLRGYRGDQRRQIRDQRYAGDRAGLVDRRFVDKKRYVNQGDVDEQFARGEHDGHLVQLNALAEFQYFLEVERPIVPPVVRQFFIGTFQQRVENQCRKHSNGRCDQR